MGTKEDDRDHYYKQLEAYNNPTEPKRVVYEISNISIERIIHHINTLLDSIHGEQAPYYTTAKVSHSLNEIIHILNCLEEM